MKKYLKIMLLCLMLAVIMLPCLSGCSNMRKRDPVNTTVDMPEEDYVIEWKDETVEAYMRDACKIAEGDVLLSDIWEINKVDIPNQTVSDLSDFSHLKNMRFISLGNAPVTDITPLSELVGLERLSVVGAQVTDLEPLAGMKHLVQLDWRDSPVTSLEPLRGMESLWGLCLDNVPVEDISPIGGLTELSRVYFIDVPIKDIEPLAGSEHMQLFELTNTKVQNINALAGSKTLKNLKLTNNPINDFSALGKLEAMSIILYQGDDPAAAFGELDGLKGLQQVDLSGCDLSKVQEPLPDIKFNSLIATGCGLDNLEIFSQLSSVVSLDVSNNQIENPKIPAGMKKMTRLDLSNNPIQNYEVLNEVVDLNGLIMRQCGLDSVPKWEALTKLRFLDLCFNNISDISNLNYLQGLSQVYLDRNQVKDISVLYNLPELHGANLTGNEISEADLAAFALHLEEKSGKGRSSSKK